MAPQRKIFSKSFDLANMTVTISTPLRTETYHTSELPESIKAKLMLYGLTQKLADKCASSAGSLTEDEKWNAMNSVYAALSVEQWSLKGESQGSYLFRALVELGGDPDATRAKIDAWTPAEKRAVSANPKVSAIIRRLESERVSEIDSDDLLSDLIG